MDRKPQQQTLSVRISETLREYLERAREVISHTRGESVSTSDVAKMLLERARNDRLDGRLEVADLLGDPTEALLTIRQKWEQGRVLSRAEWIVLAQYVQWGCEIPDEHPDLPRPESFAEVLEAFLALLMLRGKEEPAHDGYYLGNLGPSARRSEERKSNLETLTQSVRALIRTLRQEGSRIRPIFVSRNLYVALRDEDFKDAAALHQALRPFLPTLYRLAARGHWLQEREPIRPSRETKDYSYRPPVLPPIIEGDFRLSIMLTDEEDLAMALEMPTREVIYPLEPYPQIREFATMLDRLEPAGHWKGREFFGYTDAVVPERVTRFFFRHRSNGIALGFSPQDWKCLKGMFQKALVLPELAPTLTELSLQYGEV
jgi:hypothetical protein